MNNEVFIVAGGTSLQGFEFSKLKDKDVIAVNKAILDVPTAKYFITMDYTFIDHKLNDIKKIFQNSKATKIFIANLYPYYMIEEKGRIVDTRTNYVYDLSKFDMVIKSKYKSGIGFNFNQFAHGNNSGFCGLQLAICLGYKKINLLGYDLQVGETTHYHSGYKQNKEIFNSRLQKYLDNFLYTLKILKIKQSDIEIYNYSSNSLLPKTNLKNLEYIK